MPVKLYASLGMAAKGAIRDAMDAFEKETCIKMVKYEPGRHKDYVEIVSTDQNCYSQPGHIGGRQIINLQPSEHCDSLSTVIHEMMHTLGFFHEQSR